MIKDKKKLDKPKKTKLEPTPAIVFRERKNNGLTLNELEKLRKQDFENYSR